MRKSLFGTILSVVLIGVSLPAQPAAEHPQGDTWEALIEVRDNTETWPDYKPSDGWWIVPIHTTLLPQNGDVLITGWARRERDNCIIDQVVAQGGRPTGPAAAAPRHRDFEPASNTLAERNDDP